MPLQRDVRISTGSLSVCANPPQMDPPMSDWFRSVSLALDTVAYATRVGKYFFVPVYINEHSHDTSLLHTVSDGYVSISGPIL